LFHAVLLSLLYGLQAVERRCKRQENSEEKLIVVTSLRRQAQVCIWEGEGIITRIYELATSFFGLNYKVIFSAQIYLEEKRVMVREPLINVLPFIAFRLLFICFVRDSSVVPDLVVGGTECATLILTLYLSLQFLYVWIIDIRTSF
jgi:hypothetical protein